MHMNISIENIGNEVYYNNDTIFRVKYLSLDTNEMYRIVFESHNSAAVNRICDAFKHDTDKVRCW